MARKLVLEARPPTVAGPRPRRVYTDADGRGRAFTPSISRCESGDPHSGRCELDPVGRALRYCALRSSYGGCVISGVADRVPDRIRSLVYLDAFVLQDGENLLQHAPERQRNQLLEGAAGQPEGWKVPPIPAEVFKVNSNDYEWVNRQCTPQPIETFRQRIQLRGSMKIPNVTFILATGFREGSPFPPFYDKAKAKGWKTITIECGHDVMLDRPEELTRILLESAAKSAAPGG